MGPGAGRIRRKETRHEEASQESWAFPLWLFLAVTGLLPLAAQERIPPASSVMPAGYLQTMPGADRVLRAPPSLGEGVVHADPNRNC